jgi:L-lactate dehydrogenase complex protein LldG
VNSGRDTVLGRIQDALADRPRAPEIPRGYRTIGHRSPTEVVELFVERVGETGAVVMPATDPAAAVAGALAERGALRVTVAPDLDASLRPAGVEIVEDHDLPPAALDALDGSVTRCAAACAETGTIAFDGGEGQGRRAITLVPDLHVCIVRPAQIVETVPELFDRLAPSAREGRPIVLVSGPSATSDIELERVEGVHGPRQLVVVLQM